ncbi:TPA: Ail/Lom family outer membrane beta-barrel protein [Klebsiella variicola]|uniref:Ail/Lom family outer membrane beta-barrel protein n=1 Tax=Klebsiella variicola TaxID=244366 RepID=UPI0006BC680E|nr:Ail/Lom family outer membrane beta-barrel protein [Klebsiella variicola]BAS35805.1 virulence-related outer membrane protein [Klebsiella pneumoniae]QHW97783.1 Ail/Lom family outer membrane beta-barrel protein [Klebsiella variicola]VGP72286.1 Attachment invasion locus protein [Klebsiella variicola]VGP96059.1 Attachment invasion locus protein [Klebsiella variicola]HCI9590761.1 Ail/Lom family outer membrane beta-barrel protein [Klebsiella variicola]
MNKMSLAVLLVVSMTSGMVFADNHTVSIGYAQSKVQDFDNINGVNLQYRYEFDSPVSVLASFSYMQGDGEQNYHYYGDSVKNSADVKYYSLLVGPAYRINNYVSFYALGGAAYVKATGTTKWINVGDVTANYEDISEKSTSFAYGVGVIINPVENFSVNIGYEGTQADLAGNYSINGFNVGIGYRF